ncbi:hypothetical protein [Candidatus Electronema sp. JC]|uniref:hypothetical protein n=1 Tax=Candidatus Electronema sp. JC TaxID=3401570 RepID=UPI003AA84B5B
MTKEVCWETAGPHLLECFKVARHRAYVNIGCIDNTCIFIQLPNISQTEKSCTLGTKNQYRTEKVSMAVPAAHFRRQVGTVRAFQADVLIFILKPYSARPRNNEAESSFVWAKCLEGRAEVLLSAGHKRGRGFNADKCR